MASRLWTALRGAPCARGTALHKTAFPVYGHRAITSTFHTLPSIPPNALHSAISLVPLQTTDRLIANIASHQATKPNVPLSTHLASYHHGHPSVPKRSTPPPSCSSQPLHRRHRSVRARDKPSTDDETLPICAICLSMDSHQAPVVKWAANALWDNSRRHFCQVVRQNSPRQSW